MDSKSEDRLGKKEGYVQDSCARKVRGGDSEEIRIVLASSFQALSCAKAKGTSR